MKLNFFKYQATGNDFIIIDDRQHQFDIRNNNLIQKICQRRFGIGADGLILLRNDPNYDFKMIYFNADGYESSMCGNGGRCITAFANFLMPDKRFFNFTAIDGAHKSELIKFTDNGCYVSLQMKNIEEITKYQDDFIIDTGSPHYVKFVADNHHLNVALEGRKIRSSEHFIKEGINVNFVEIDKDEIHVRTYERGVEDETLSCGTGVTASALAAHFSGILQKNRIQIITPGGALEVKFENLELGVYQDIFLLGDADFVFEGNIEI